MPVVGLVHENVARRPDALWRRAARAPRFQTAPTLRPVVPGDLVEHFSFLGRRHRRPASRPVILDGRQQVALSKTGVAQSRTSRLTLIFFITSSSTWKLSMVQEPRPAGNALVDPHVAGIIGHGFGPVEVGSVNTACKFCRGVAGEFNTQMSSRLSVVIVNFNAAPPGVLLELCHWANMREKLTLSLSTMPPLTAARWQPRKPGLPRD